MNPLVRDFFTYKQHVDNETYDDPDLFLEYQDGVEKAWPLYEASADLLVQPAVSGPEVRHVLQATSPEEVQRIQAQGAEWREGYMRTVQRTQMMRNHHIHPDKDENGARKPASWCICKSRPGECKHGFPKTMQVQDSCCVVCTGVGEALGLRTSGKKSALGAVSGPRNNEWLNSTHRGLAYSLGDNSDTLLAYRLPIIHETHSKLCTCEEACLCAEEELKGLLAVLRSQRDTAGYMTGYMTKRTPIARNEIKAFVYGQHQLCDQLDMSKAATVRYARRATQRLMSALSCSSNAS